MWFLKMEPTPFPGVAKGLDKQTKQTQSREKKDKSAGVGVSDAYGTDCTNCAGGKKLQEASCGCKKNNSPKKKKPMMQQRGQEPASAQPLKKSGTTRETPFKIGVETARETGKKNERLVQPDSGLAKKTKDSRRRTVPLMGVTNPRKVPSEAVKKGGICGNNLADRIFLIPIPLELSEKWAPPPKRGEADGARKVPRRPKQRLTGGESRKTNRGVREPKAVAPLC